MGRDSRALRPLHDLLQSLCSLGAGWCVGPYLRGGLEGLRQRPADDRPGVGPCSPARRQRQESLKLAFNKYQQLARLNTSIPQNPQMKEESSPPRQHHSDSDGERKWRDKRRVSPHKHSKGRGRPKGLEVENGGHTKHFWSYRGLTVRQPTVVRRYEMGNGKTTLAVVRHGSSLTAVRFLVVLP